MRAVGDLPGMGLQRTTPTTSPQPPENLEMSRMPLTEARSIADRLSCDIYAGRIAMDRLEAASYELAWCRTNDERDARRHAEVRATIDGRYEREERRARIANDRMMMSLGRL